MKKKLLFIGEIHNREKICIKFVRRYSPNVHEKCAEMGIAPKLRGFEKYRCGMENGCYGRPRRGVYILWQRSSAFGYSEIPHRTTSRASSSPFRARRCTSEMWTLWFRRTASWVVPLFGECLFNGILCNPVIRKRSGNYNLYTPGNAAFLRSSANHHWK